MISVRQAAYDIFRSHQLTTVFGNPGSTELPMLADLPTDFRYLTGVPWLAATTALPLSRAVAVVPR